MHVLILQLVNHEQEHSCIYFLLKESIALGGWGGGTIFSLTAEKEIPYAFHGIYYLKKNEWPFHLPSLILIELQRIVTYLNISTFIKHLISVSLKILWFVNTCYSSGPSINCLTHKYKFYTKVNWLEINPSPGFSIHSSHSKFSFLQLKNIISLLLPYKMKFYIFFENSEFSKHILLLQKT